MDLHIQYLVFSVNLLFGVGFACAYRILGLQVGRIVDHTNFHLLLSVSFDG